MPDYKKHHEYQKCDFAGHYTAVPRAEKTRLSSTSAILYPHIWSWTGATVSMSHPNFNKKEEYTALPPSQFQDSIYVTDIAPCQTRTNLGRHKPTGPIFGRKTGTFTTKVQIEPLNTEPLGKRSGCIRLTIYLWRDFLLVDLHSRLPDVLPRVVAVNGKCVFLFVYCCTKCFGCARIYALNTLVCNTT